nr:hypothetical protein [Halococcus saccharolyticus]
MGGLSALILNVVLPESGRGVPETEGGTDTNVQISGEGPATDED